MWVSWLRMLLSARWKHSILQYPSNRRRLSRHNCSQLNEVLPDFARENSDSSPMHFTLTTCFVLTTHFMLVYEICTWIWSLLFFTFGTGWPGWPSTHSLPLPPIRYRVVTDNGGWVRASTLLWGFWHALSSRMLYVEKSMGFQSGEDGGYFSSSQTLKKTVLLHSWTVLPG